MAIKSQQFAKNSPKRYLDFFLFSKISLTSHSSFYTFMVTNIGYHKSMEKDLQAQILKILKASPSGLQMEELAEKMGLTRHTIAKYLEVLRAEGKIHYHKVGRTKLWKDIFATTNIRLLTMDDLF